MDDAVVGGLGRLASECVALTASQFGAHLDFSLASLEEVDRVCAELLSDGPLASALLELWWKLLSAYTGETLIRTYDGSWIEHEKADGSYAVDLNGLVGFPFSTVSRILSGEPFKSLASMGRAIPAIRERSQGPDS